MRSFKYQPDNRKQIHLALVGQIEGQLRDAYAKRHEKDGETQASIAEKLGIDRSAVHRRLTGRSNMTIETIADMVWALGHCINVEIFDPAVHKTNHRHVVPISPHLRLDEGGVVLRADRVDPLTAELAVGRKPWVRHESGAALAVSGGDENYRTEIQMPVDRVDLVRQ